MPFIRIVGSTANVFAMCAPRQNLFSPMHPLARLNITVSSPCSASSRLPVQYRYYLDSLVLPCTLHTWILASCCDQAQGTCRSTEISSHSFKSAVQATSPPPLPTNHCAGARTHCNIQCAIVSELSKGFWSLRWFGCGKCGDISQEGTGIALESCLCVFRLHPSRGRMGCSGASVFINTVYDWWQQQQQPWPLALPRPPGRLSFSQSVAASQPDLPRLPPAENASVSAH